MVSEVEVVVKQPFLSLQYTLGLSCLRMLVEDGPVPVQRPRRGVGRGWVSSESPVRRLS